MKSNWQEWFALIPPARIQRRPERSLMPLCAATDHGANRSTF
jgi:hypothetical protein